MKAGDTLLVHDTTLSSRLIQWGTHSYWNHSALIINDSGDLIEAVRTGVRTNNVKNYANLNTKVISFNIDDEDAQHAIAWAKTQVGKHYNFMDIVSIFFVLVLHSPIDISLDGRWICSALSGEAYEHAGLILPKDPDRTWPQDLLDWSERPLSMKRKT